MTDARICTICGVPCAPSDLYDFHHVSTVVVDDDPKKPKPRLRIAPPDVCQDCAAVHLTGFYDEVEP